MTTALFSTFMLAAVCRLLLAIAAVFSGAAMETVRNPHRGRFEAVWWSVLYWLSITFATICLIAVPLPVVLWLRGML